MRDSCGNYEQIGSVRVRAPIYVHVYWMSQQERKVIGEKRVNKNFQYDSPGDLVITYLSEVTKDKCTH